MRIFGRSSDNRGGQGYNPLRQALRRMLSVKIVLLLAFVIVALRLVQIQVISSVKYKELAREQYEARITLPAVRGSIYDRNGNVIVSNTVLVSFAADPIVLDENRRAVAGVFSDVFGKPRSYYLERLKTGNRFAWLERGVSQQIARKIPSDKFPGLIRLNEPERLYHHDHLAGQVIGFTNVDNVGLSGVELEFDELLRGANGELIMQRDGLGRKRPSVDYPHIDPVNGSSIFLTIDLEYQAIVEDELRKGVERSKAESGLAVMLDPTSGEILAMANYPFFDPTRSASSNQAVMKNRTITDVFEPGSMFKIVTASAALQDHLVDPDRTFYAEQGQYRVPLPGGKSRVISDTHPYGMLTFREAVEFSSNIVIAKISDIIGNERLYVMARNYGFGIATGVELPGEVRGELKKPDEWSGTTLNSMSIGYEVGVTPLQIATAYAAVADNGVLLKPTIVREIVRPDGEISREMRPQRIRTVVSGKTCRILHDFFTGVVEEGTGRGARIENFAIAGKTGTARKVIDGKYQTGSYTASFVGFYPADNPKIVCLVMLDNPRAGGYTGGLASAPIFRAIAAKVRVTSDKFRKAQPLFTGKRPVNVPDVTNLTPAAAQTMLEERGFDVRTTGTGSLVLRQSPEAGKAVDPESTVELATDPTVVSARDGYAIVPDLRGLSMRRAVNRLTMLQLGVRIEGSGVVKDQSPRKGDEMRIGATVVIRCTPALQASL